MLLMCTNQVRINCVYGLTIQTVTVSIIFFESLDILTSLKSDMFNCVQSNTIMFLRAKKVAALKQILGVYHEPCLPK